MILVDTSVWIDHFRNSDPRLAEALNRQQVSIHPIVIGELATGNLKDRKRTLLDLRSLPMVSQAGFDECLEMIELRKLYGLELGWNDAQLLASSILEGIPLWTNDKTLNVAAKSLRLSYL